MVAAVLVILSMGVLTWKGATAKESLGSELVREVPMWAKEQGFENNPTAIAGATLFAECGCANCHTYLGSGSSNLGAPDLTADGAQDKGIDFQFAHLRGRPGQPGQRRCRRTGSSGARRSAPADRRVPRGLEGPGERRSGRPPRGRAA